MKVRITIDVDDDTRKSIAVQYWGHSGKASREECRQVLEGFLIADLSVLADDAEDLGASHLGETE